MPSATTTTITATANSSDRSVRRDFILNLETLLQREVVGTSSKISTTTTSMSTSTSSVMVTKGKENDRFGDHQHANNIDIDDHYATWAMDSQHCRRHHSDADNDIHGKGIGTFGEIEPGGVDGGDSLSARQVLLPSDRHSIRTYPLRVIDQLRLCYQTTPSSYNASSSCSKSMRICGFECIHCNKLHKSNDAITIRQKNRVGYRKFPKHVNDVIRDLLDFRSHLNLCSNVPSELNSYLNWMEGWCRFHKVVKSVAIPISHRLDGLRNRGNASALVLAPATAKNLVPMPSPQKKKRKVVGNNSDMALLTKMKRSARRRSQHSVLENINALA